MLRLANKMNFAGAASFLLVVLQCTLAIMSPRGENTALVLLETSKGHMLLDGGTVNELG